MATFAVASAIFLLLGLCSASIPDHCTDISYWDVLSYETTTKQCCDTKLKQVCTTKTDQVCQDVLELQCEVVAWGECKSTPTSIQSTKCDVKYNDFAHQNCKELAASVKHTKKVPECRVITKNNCVTDWDVDASGNKVWAGTETCTPVSWEECDIVEKTVEFPTVKTECNVDSDIKWADFVNATTNIIGLESKCEVKKAVNCKHVVTNKCAPVVWQECNMEPREECLAKVIHTPNQEKIHRKNCLAGDIDHGNIKAIDGGWTSYGSCTKTCKGGVKTRTCTNPSPQQGGKPCTGDASVPCNQNIDCAIDGGWTSYGPCTKTCKGGVKTRTCTNPSPQQGGKPCTGDASVPCNQNIDCVVNMIYPGTKIIVGTVITSTNGEYSCGMQRNGNFAITNRDDVVTWSTNTVGQDLYFEFRFDGTLGIYDQSGGSYWSAGTFGKGSGQLVLENTGFLVLYRLSGEVLWTSQHHKLLRGQTFKAGYSMGSSNGVYTLTMQDNGHLVLSSTHGSETWDIGTSGLGAGASLQFHSDGNLVLYGGDHVAKWDSGTGGSNAKALVLQDDGQLVLCCNEDGGELWIGVGNFIREGNYECIGGKEKSDSNYAEIKRWAVGRGSGIALSGSREIYKWINKAGEAWTLYPTDEINVLRVGEDSPHYASSNHRTAVFNAAGVSGPSGCFFVFRGGKAGPSPTEPESDEAGCLVAQLDVSTANAINNSPIGDFTGAARVKPASLTFPLLLENYHRLLDLADNLTEDLRQKTDTINLLKTKYNAEKDWNFQLTKDMERVVAEKVLLQEKLQRIEEQQRLTLKLLSETKSKSTIYSNVMSESTQISLGSQTTPSISEQFIESLTAPSISPLCDEVVSNLPLQKYEQSQQNSHRSDNDLNVVNQRNELSNAKLIEANEKIDFLQQLASKTDKEIAWLSVLAKESYSVTVNVADTESVGKEVDRLKDLLQQLASRRPQIEQLLVAPQDGQQSEKGQHQMRLQEELDSTHQGLLSRKTKLTTMFEHSDNAGSKAAEVSKFLGMLEQQLSSHSKVGKTKEGLLGQMRDVKGMSRELTEYSHHITLFSQLCQKLVSIYGRDDTSVISSRGDEVNRRYSYLSSNCLALGKALQVALNRLNQFDSDLAIFMAWLGEKEAVLERLEKDIESGTEVRTQLSEIQEEVRAHDANFRCAEKLAASPDTDITEVGSRWTELQNIVLRLVCKVEGAGSRGAKNMQEWTDKNMEELTQLKLGGSVVEITKQIEEHNDFRYYEEPTSTVDFETYPNINTWHTKNDMDLFFDEQIKKLLPRKSAQTDSGNQSSSNSGMNRSKYLVEPLKDEECTSKIETGCEVGELNVSQILMPEIVSKPVCSTLSNKGLVLKKNSPNLIDLAEEDESDQSEQDKKTRLFIMKSNNDHNIVISKRTSRWKTQNHNDYKLKQAMKTSDVFLLFSVKGSQKFCGLARMSSEPLTEEDVQWETPENVSLGDEFPLKWIYENSLSFEKVKHLRNEKNEMKSVKVSRDGQEVETRCGQEILKIYQQEDSNLKSLRKVKISHVVSPSEIYVNNIEESDKISLLNSMIHSSAKSSCTKSLPWTPGNQCIAKLDDHTWGRAKITHMKKEGSMVMAVIFFYDTGKIKEVSTQDLKTLPEEVKSQPPFASRVHLSDIKPTCGKWSATTSKQMKQLLDEQDNIVIIKNDGYLLNIPELDMKSQPVKIRLEETIDQGPLSPLKKIEVSLSSKLIDKGLGQKTISADFIRIALLKSNGIEYDERSNARHVQNSGIIEKNATPVNIPLPDTPPSWEAPQTLSVKEFIGKPTHVDWDCNLYIQTSENQKNINEITNILNSNFTRSLPEEDLNWLPGQRCIVQFHIDKNWCRGTVVKRVNESTFEVEFVDFGNREHVSALKMRKTLFMESLPVQCFRLKLDDVVSTDQDGKWSKETLDKIHKLVVDQPFNVNVTNNIRKGFPIMGSLKTIEGIKIASVLIQKGYAKKSSGQVRRSVSFDLDLKTGENEGFKLLSWPYNIGDEFVVIPTLIANGKLFCQLYLSDRKAFLTLSDRLQEVWNQQPVIKNPQVGMRVIAPFKEDRKWYRAVVKNCSPKTVLFVDYGNEELAEEVRQLPSEMGELPAQGVLLNVRSKNTSYLERCAVCQPSRLSVILPACGAPPCPPPSASSVLVGSSSVDSFQFAQWKTSLGLHPDLV